MTELLPPWSQPDLLPPKPSDDSYGYVFRGIPTNCPREALIERCREFAGSDMMPVWAPETERMVPAIELPFLHDAIRERMRKTVRSGLQVALFFLILYGLPMLLPGYPRLEFQLLLLLSFAIIPLVEGCWRLRQLRRETPETLAARTISARYAIWIERQRKVIAWVLFAVISAVFVCQMIGGLGDSIARAGLTKTGLHLRDSYRFLTATLMHGGVMHLIMNALVLLFLGMAVEALVGGIGLAFIFTASALGGSVLSFVFVTQPSVGASGGIMGLIGFLAVLGFHFRKILPPRFGRQMLYSVFLTALTGLAARHVIDNAAHAGGLLVGAALGWLLVRLHPTLPLRLPAGIRWAGALSLALILAAAIFICTLFVRYS